VTVLLVIAGWIDLASTVVLAGGYLSAALITPPGTSGRRLIRWAAATLAVGLLAEVAVNTIRMAPIAESSGVAFVADAFGTRWCQLWVARCVGLGFLLTLRVGSWPGAGLAALWLGLRSFQGHPGAHGTWPATVDWLHLLAAVSWLGSLVQFALLRGTVPPHVAVRVRRLATISVVALVPAGIYGALLHIPSVDRLFHSPYGRTLLVKLTLVAVLLVLGAANHFRYVPRLLRDRDPTAAQRLRRVVWWEIVIAALVVLMSALLGVLPMPHAMPH